MNRDQLNNLFTLSKLKKKEFSKMLGVSYVTVNGWGSSQNIPYWVESWLKNYIKAKKFDEMMEFAKQL